MKPEKRLRFLVGVLVILTGVFAFLAVNSPEGNTLFAFWEAKKRAWENQRRFKQALASDPTIGTTFKQLGINLSPPSNSSLPMLVVVFGGCEGCGARNLEEWAEVFSKWETVRKEIAGILVIRDKAEKVNEVVSKNGWKVKVIADEDGSISKALNAFFSPRAYGFIEGKLVWVQKEAGMGVVRTLEEFVKVVKGEEEASRLINAWSAEMRGKVWEKETSSQVKGSDKR